MKKIIFILTTFFLLTVSSFAQNETATESSRPTTDTEIVRRCASLDIEGKVYEDVIITMKSTSPDYFVTDKYKVKVQVKDQNGKKIYKKTFSNAYLYIFSNGQIQIGKPKFNQIVITKGTLLPDLWFGQIREKEGIW